MSLESKEVWWVECDQCQATFGDPDDGKNIYGDYEDEEELIDQAEEDGWKRSGNDWFCEECAVRKGLVELTPIQQAVAMHGKEPFLASTHGFTR